MSSAMDRLRVEMVSLMYNSLHTHLNKSGTWLSAEYTSKTIMNYHRVSSYQKVVQSNTIPLANVHL
jgi:hypothetical protein